MNKITLEMPMITQCSVSNCAYNGSSMCHARAITIGDSVHPGCDTYLAGSIHIRQAERVAGVGACKTATCKHNDDLECMADNIRVDMVNNIANCMTFVAR